MNGLLFGIVLRRCHQDFTSKTNISAQTMSYTAPRPGLARGSPALLPTLHLSTSRSNLCIQDYRDPSQGPSPIEVNAFSSSPPRELTDSSASSVINMEVAEGLLLQEIDAENTDVSSRYPFVLYNLEGTPFLPREYFILTAAGKPVFIRYIFLFTSFHVLIEHIVGLVALRIT